MMSRIKAQTISTARPDKLIGNFRPLTRASRPENIQLMQYIAALQTYAESLNPLTESSRTRA